MFSVIFLMNRLDNKKGPGIFLEKNLFYQFTNKIFIVF